MNKKYLVMTMLLLASAIVVAGVQGITALMGSSEEEGSLSYREIYEQSIDVKSAVAICQETGETATENSFYVRGTVSSASIDTDKYGNATIYLKQEEMDEETGETSTSEIELYRVYYFNGAKFTSTDAIKVGDEVIAYGKLVNYKGNTPEMVQNGYIVAVNGKTSEEVSPVNPEEPIKMDTITIYVDAEDAPHLYVWNNQREFTNWPGEQLTEQTTIGGHKFWHKSYIVNHVDVLVANGDLEGDNVKNFISKEAPSEEMIGATIVEGAGVNGSRGIVVKSADDPATAWDSQFWIYLDNTYYSGTKFHVEFDYKAKEDARVSTQSHKGPGEYNTYYCMDDLYFTTEWKHFSGDFEVDEKMAGSDTGNDGFQSIAFQLSEESYANEYYFDNFVVTNYSGNNGGLNIIFNDANGNQTEDIKGIYETRYYWYSGKTLYKDVTKDVLEGTYTTPLMEEITFPDEYRYMYDGDTLYYNKVKLTFHRNNNKGDQPYNYYGEMTVFSGNSMTITSEEPMVDLKFYTNNEVNHNIRGEASEGKLETNHWTGDTEELTITNTTGEWERFRKVVITFDNPTIEELIARLATQIELSEAAIADLAHQAVYGKDALSQLIADSKTLIAADDPDYEQAKAYVRDLKEARAAINNLDAAYTRTETALTALATAGEDNDFVDPAKKEAATTFITETQTGIGQGAYNAQEIAAIQEKINWHAAQLEMVYLTIALGDPGTLGDEVLSRVTNFTDIQGLRLSGKVDDTDMERIKGQMTNLQEIDLSDIDLKTIPYEQFRNRTLLTSVKLPAGLETIGNYAFYGCYNMESFELPATLKTIGEYAFYNCSKFTELIVPEGVTSIGNNAFQCNTGYSYVYDENGNYKYDENGNRIQIYYGSNLKKVTLPNSLTYLGTGAFRYCISLEEVNIPSGLTYINNEVFEGCTALKSITIPANIQKINYEAFYGSGVVNVELSEGLNIINSNAFGECDSLKAIILPSSVNSVYYPFSDCDNLKSITVKAIAPPYANSNSIMGGREGQCTLYVPELSLAAYKQTDKWSDFAPNIFGLNIMPENIIISDTYRLLWPDTVSFDYKPNVELTKMDRGNSNYWYGDDRYRYAAVTVTGNATLSAKEFSMYYDYYFMRNNNSDTYSRFATLINNGKIRTDNNILKLHLYADQWNFIALPFDVKVSDIVNVNNTQFVIRGYDVEKRANAKMDETWYDMKGDDILEAGKGYIWQAAHTTTENEDGYYNENYDIEFDVQALQTVNKNNMFQSNSVEIELEENLSEFPQNRSWNFIGNPYPCYFDTRAIDCTAPITVWEDGYQYRAYSPVDDKYILAPGEAFFMQRPLDQASITFLREGRQMNPQVRDITYFTNTRQSEMTAKRSVFNLKIEGADQNDQTRFVINENASLAYEMDKDASKFMDATVKGIQFYTIEDGLRYAINERPLAKGEVALGMKIVKDGSYTITLDTKSDAEVYLIDLETGVEIKMDEAGYTFQAKAGTADNRFIVRLGGNELTGISTIDNLQQKDENYYDLQGRRVTKDQLKNGIYVKKGRKAVVK